MSYSPSSTNVGQASSPPDVGTPQTVYSPEVNRTGNVGARGQLSAKAAGKQPVKVDSLAPPPRTQAKFVNEIDRHDAAFISRQFVVISYPNGIWAGMDPEFELADIQARLKEYLAFSKSVPFYSRGVHVRFDSLRDSCEAKYLLECLGYAAEYLTGYELAVAKSQDTAAVNDYEGQVSFALMVKPFDCLTRQGIDELGDTVAQIAAFYGDIRDMVHAGTNATTGTIRFRVEFQSIDAANRAVQGVKMIALYGETDHWSWRTMAPTPWVGPPRDGSPLSKTPQKDDQGRLVGFLHPPVRRPIDRYSAHPHDEHQQVSRERIEAGHDVRTTVMLRNIPNKLDWMSLKAILDNICFGAYDFIYLRIDFKSACNVGYAFINFTDMQGMLKMVEVLEHRTWNGYRSAKAAEISYATVQGKEALTQKFRNSSVLQQAAFCHPRLFMSSHDAASIRNLRLAGTEVEFPRPDNPAKLQRSMDSALTVGLYPPAGSGNQNDHRNRSSAYDRGTPRDLVQSAAAMAGQSNNQPPLYSWLPPNYRRDIEVWYNHAFAGDHHGFIPFQCISIERIDEFFHSGYDKLRGQFLQNPGVIGRPPVGPVTSHQGNGYYGTAAGSPDSSHQGRGRGGYESYNGTGNLQIYNDYSRYNSSKYVPKKNETWFTQQSGPAY